MMKLSFGQDYYSNFKKHFSSGDKQKQLETLEAWEISEPENAELFTSYFNYYYFLSKKEVLSLGTSEPKSEAALEIKDDQNNTAGYLGSDIKYNPDILEKAFAWIDRGITLHPKRLDMRFGKIHALGEAELWERFNSNIVQTIHHAENIDYQWLWTNNEPYQGNKQNFFSSIQDYQLKLYNTGNDMLLKHMRTIAMVILEKKSDHVESLSNLSITYLLEKKYEKALEPLLTAEKIDPKDPIILFNIAHAYKLMGDKENSIAYYEKIIKLDDQKAAEYAKEQITALKKD